MNLDSRILAVVVVWLGSPALAQAPSAADKPLHAIHKAAAAALKPRVGPSTTPPTASTTSAALPTPAVEPSRAARAGSAPPRTLEAQGDLAPHPAQFEPSLAVAAEPEAPPREVFRPRVLIGVRGGVLIPFSFLSTGYEVDLEAEVRLPVFDGRLRLGLAAGFAQLTGKGSRIVPGRGLETSFIENIAAFPIELSGRLEVWRSEKQAVLAGAGYAAYVTLASFNALGTNSTQSVTALGHTAVLIAAYRRALGPGEVGAAVRANLGAVSLGQLGGVGTDRLNSIAFTVSYAFGF